MTLLAGFFDAAGDHASSDAVTVGGYMAPVRSWSRFRRDWRRELDAHSIRVFHMTDFVAGYGDFLEWKDKQETQMAFLKKLAKVIVRHSHFSPATTILLRDWKRLNAKYRLKECHATPYAIASIGVINKSIQWMKREHPHDHLTGFVFEQGDRGHGDLMFFMDHVRERSPDLAGIYPQFKAKTLEPLQACDFAAWEQRYLVKQRLAGKRYDKFRESLSSLLVLKRDWGVSDFETLEDWVQFLDVPKRSQPMTQREVAKWKPRPLRREQ